VPEKPKKTPLVKLLLALSHVPVWGKGKQGLYRQHILGMLDSWGHKAHLPPGMQHPFCDAWDWYLGVFDDDETDSGADCKD
jgi:hypothetical protein